MSSCDSNIFHRKISEGIIEYKVTYPDVDTTLFMANFLPDKMIMKFKKYKYINELSAGMGMYKFNFMSNSKDYLSVHTAKLINRKIAIELDRIETKKINKKDYPSISIIPINETKIIAGYNCKKALVVFNELNKNSFYVYYTDEIDIYDPNWGLPFSEIGSVLLEYQISYFKMNTTFVATNVTKTDIEDETFIIPDDYEIIPYEQMYEEVGGVFETFNY